MEHGTAKIFMGIYQLLSWLLQFTVFPFLLLYFGLSGKHRRGLLQRLGYYRLNLPANAKPIWLHAASVGEAQAAHKLLTMLRQWSPDATYIITTVTEQGKQVAQTLSGSHAQVMLAPLDFPLSVINAVRHIRPTIYICLETELWPNVLYFLHHSGALLFMANGRISHRSFTRYRRCTGLMRYLLCLFSEIAVIGREDKERFIELGAEPGRVHETGNIKFDLGMGPGFEEVIIKLRQSLTLKEENKIFICGSTRKGEEEQLLDTYLGLKKHIQHLVWIIAPRHLERLKRVGEFLQKHKIKWQYLSDCRDHGRTAKVILVDTMGELKNLYGLGTYIFCGGSLVPKGGHNIMEAAFWGRPVFHGPFMQDFSDAQKLLKQAAADLTVHSAAELTERILSLHREPEQYDALCRRTLQAAEKLQNVAKRQAELIAGYL
jgi:3-deoxy-D-manno-octulosonic-acid transferase